MIKIWHGSHRWEGPPEIRPLKTGKYEFGPGIYTTTNLSRAARYAKGGGKVVQFEIDPDVKWLSGAEIPFDDMISFVENSCHIRKKRILVKDIKECWDAKDRESSNGMIPMSFLVNLGVNNECFSGKGGIEVAEFLADNDVQADLCRRTGDEEWVVIFDPEVIKSHKVLSAKDLDWDQDFLPSIMDQISQMKPAGMKI